MDLYAEVDKNSGLEHGKVKEYWLFRGPRQAMTLLLGMFGTAFVNEMIKDDITTNDRIAYYVNSSIMLLVAFFMLYYRLPDAINSAVCRSAHDFYVSTKKKGYF